MLSPNYRLRRLDARNEGQYRPARTRVPPATGPVHPYQVVVRELALRVLVQPPLVAVRRKVVDVEVVLLHALAVVALAIRQAVP